MPYHGLADKARAVLALSLLPPGIHEDTHDHYLTRTWTHFFLRQLRVRLIEWLILDSESCVDCFTYVRVQV